MAKSSKNKIKTFIEDIFLVKCLNTQANLKGATFSLKKVFLMDTYECICTRVVITSFAIESPVISCDIDVTL